MRVNLGACTYGVIGEIDMQALRQFLSCFRTPAKPFKLVPDGCEIDFGRKVFSAGEKE